jgi:hypothetical protein
MSLFVEVESVEKQCTVIINLDTVMEIAPLRTGGCEISFPDGAAVNGKRTMKVKDNYINFKQFAMQSVSADMIADRLQKIEDKIPPEMRKPKKVDKIQTAPVVVGADESHL